MLPNPNPNPRLRVRVRVGCTCCTTCSHSELHHSTELCWRNRMMRLGGAASSFTMARMSSGVLSGSPCRALRMNPGVSVRVWRRAA